MNDDLKRDLIVYGEVWELNGKRIPPEDIYMTQSEIDLKREADIIRRAIWDSGYSFPASISKTIEVALQSVRDKALEEAAERCDENARTHQEHGQSTWGALAESQAAEIRALKDPK